MELQFPKSTYDYLRRVLWEVKNEEQTQELKLPETMPDVGKVLGAWGQCVIRSKEWRGNNMSISGGVMGWVLYMPEDGSQPQRVETWIPFQIRWDFPQTQRDGAMEISCQVRSMDARTVSARKLMVRAVVSAAGEAMEPAQTEIYMPGPVPEDVQILRMQYPVRLVREAGEKTFNLDEELTLSASCAQAQRLVYYTLQLEMIDRKIMADKVVFRGAVVLRGLCQCQDGTIKSFDFEIPFSQYAELEREYDPYATAEVIPAVTNLELEMGENGLLRLKAGMVGQYTVYDRPVFEVAEDAYSPNRFVDMEDHYLCIPAVLDSMLETIKAEIPMHTEYSEIVDMVFTLDHPRVRQEENMAHMSLSGGFQILYLDAEGKLQSEFLRWDGEHAVPADKHAAVMAWAGVTGKARESGGNVSCDIWLRIVAVADTDIPMINALELGELQEPDPGRPSLILRRTEGEGLWKIAKQCGSTVDAIRAANDIDDEAQPNQLLMIPIS